MNSVLAILVFSCVIFQHGSDAVITVEQVEDVATLVRPKIAWFSMPDLNNEVMIFRPTYVNPPPGAPEEYSSTITLTEGAIEGFNNINVDGQKIATDHGNSERFNLTFCVKKLTYEFDVDFSSVVSYKGHVVGKLLDVKICIPIDTTNNVVTIAAPVHVDMWGPELTFTEGLPMLDRMFNDHNYFWYEYSREILQKHYVRYCIDQIIKAVNEQLPKVIGNNNSQ